MTRISKTQKNRQSLAIGGAKIDFDFKKKQASPDFSSFAVQFISKILNTVFSNMKKLIFLPVLALWAIAAVHIDTYNVDASASNIVWTARKVTGQHTGNVKFKSGALNINHGTLVGGQFEVDMNSITCTDLQGEWGDKLIGHLKSPDFFGTETHPTAKFVMTRAIPTDTKGNYRIVGDLTIKTTTKSIKFDANLANNGRSVTATGKIVIDRSEFDIRYGSGSFFDGLGDKTIYDDFDLNFSLVGNL